MASYNFARVELLNKTYFWNSDRTFLWEVWLTTEQSFIYVLTLILTQMPILSIRSTALDATEARVSIRKWRRFGYSFWKNTRCQVIFTRWKQTFQLCPGTACVGWESFLCIFSMGLNVWLWFQIQILKQEIWQMN